MDDLATYLQTFGSQLPSIQDVIFLVAGTIGFISVGASLLHLITQGRRGQNVMPATFAGVIFGSLMLSLRTVVDITAVSFFGESADTQVIDSFTQLGSSETSVRKALHALMAAINVVGWIAAARGIYRWKNGPKYEQPGWFGAGLTFIIAGMLATNMYVFADVLAVSVGASQLGTEYFKFNFTSVGGG